MCALVSQATPPHGQACADDTEAAARLVMAAGAAMAAVACSQALDGGRPDKAAPQSGDDTSGPGGMCDEGQHMWCMSSNP